MRAGPQDRQADIPQNRIAGFNYWQRSKGLLCDALGVLAPWGYWTHMIRLIFGLPQFFMAHFVIVDEIDTLSGPESFQSPLCSLDNCRDQLFGV